MTELTTIELFKEDMKFSAGHYTIFSAEHREPLHGHNFNVYAAITAETDDNGMAFDYAIYKKKLRQLCNQLNSRFLIAGDSNLQRLEQQGDHLYVHFANERIPFLKSDVLILPIKNITVEELSKWFVLQLISEQDELNKHAIHSITIKVFSAPGQSGSYHWQA